MNKLLILTLTIITIITSNSFALSPEPHLKNEAQEQRAQSLFLEVRCLVCQGQVIENSDTEFSYEMRQLIRKKIKAGKTTQEIKNELTTEFGQDILISTDPNKNNLLLWLLPIIFAIFLLINFRRIFSR